MAFQNSVVGGITLVRPAIQSPDYQEGSSGWTINVDGSAEFNDVTIRGGTVVSGTALYYDGPPALGNLILSIAAQAGVDEYGNAYDQGITAYDSSGSYINIEAGSGSSTMSFVPRTIAGVDWQAGGIGQALSSRLGTNTPQMFAASPYNRAGSGSSSISFYGNPQTSNGDVTSEVIISGARTTILSANVWLTGGPIQMYDGNTFDTWTPTVAGAGSGTFSTDGFYQRIGKMVFVRAYIQTINAGTGTSNVTFTLPVTPYRSGARQVIPGSALDGGVAGAGPVAATIFVGGSGADVDRITNSAGTTVTGSMMTAGSIWTFEGWIREA